MRQEIAAVTANTELMPQIHLVWLEAPYIASQAQPGQFVMAHCGEDTLLRRPFSVHQADGNRLALFFNVVGRGTHWLSQRQPGDRLDLLGPLGKGYKIQAGAHKLLLLAGGIGIAPLYFLAQAGLADAQLFLRTPPELSDGQIFRFKLALALARRPKFITIDQFTDSLDRVTAQILAHNIRKFATKFQTAFLLASPHSDVLDQLQPDLYLEKLFAETPTLKTRRQ